MVQSGLMTQATDIPVLAEYPPTPESDFVDLEPRPPGQVPEKREGWTLSIVDEREGRLSTPAAQWMHERGCSRLRIQRNVQTGEVFLLPTTEEPPPGPRHSGIITVRAHRGGAPNPLPRRFYTVRLIRWHLVKPKQVVKLRVVGPRLLLIGVKAVV